jgi:hypothetical protein
MDRALPVIMDEAVALKMKADNKDSRAKEEG